MKQFSLVVMICCGLALPAIGQESGSKDAEAAAKPTVDKTSAAKAIELLKKSQKALERVKLARYQAKYDATGWVKQYVADVEGAAAIGEPSEYDVTRFRCEGKLTPKDAEEAMEIAAGCDGDLFYLIDSKTKTVYADMDNAVLGSHSRDIQRLLIPDFVSKEPLAELVKVENVELKDSVSVEGQDCWQVHIARSDTRAETWFISKSDSLPRRIDRLYVNEKKETGSTRLIIRELTVKNEMNLAPFKLNVPAGFTQTDDFAP